MDPRWRLLAIMLPGFSMSRMIRLPERSYWSSPNDESEEME